MFARIQQGGFFLKRGPQHRLALKDHVEDAVLLKPEVVLPQHAKLHVAWNGNHPSRRGFLRSDQAQQGGLAHAICAHQSVAFAGIEA